MLRIVLAAMATTFIFAGSASAQEMMKCDDATVMKVSEAVKMAPEAMKDKAMKELEMAKEKMAGGMADDCAMHLDAANKAAMMQ